MRAAIYARVSTEEQSMNYSVDTQLEAARGVAATRGVEIVGEYIDEGWSGTVANRPAFNRLMRACGSGEIDVIIVYRIDRFFRNARHLLETMDFLESKGVKFISATEPFDTSTPVGKFMVGQFGLIAELERNTIMERTRGGRLKRAASGKWWGPPPYGYKYDAASGVLVIDEKEAEVIRRAFEFYREPGETLDSVADKLNVLGYRTRHGHRWSGPAIHSLLTRELYAGTAYLRSGQTQIPLTVPEIISIEELEHTARLLEQRRLIRDPKKRTRTFLLRSLVRCGECGSLMGPGYANKTKDGYLYYYYTCYGSRFRRSSRLDRNEGFKDCSMAWIPAEVLEEAVWAVIVRLITEPERVRATLEEMTLEPVDQEPTENVSQRLEILTVQRKALLRSFRDGLLSEEELRKTLQEIAEEEALLQRKMEALDNVQKTAGQHVQMFEAFHRSYCNVIRSLSNEEKRDVVLALVHKVEVFLDSTVKITFNPPDDTSVPFVLTTQLRLSDKRAGVKKRGRKKKREYVYVFFPKDTYEKIRLAASLEQLHVTVFIMHAVKSWLEAGGELSGISAWSRQRLVDSDKRRVTAVLDRETLKALKEKSMDTGISMSFMIRAAVERKLDSLGPLLNQN